MKIKKFNQSKFDEAAKRQQENPDETKDRWVESDFYAFQCWDCDKKYLNGNFFTTSILVKVKCPRHPSHQNVEYIGRAIAKLRWDQSKVNPLFID